jgi:hypothetical protein
VSYGAMQTEVHVCGRKDEEALPIIAKKRRKKVHQPKNQERNEKEKNQINKKRKNISRAAHLFDMKRLKQFLYFYPIRCTKVQYCVHV